MAFSPESKRGNRELCISLLGEMIFVNAFLHVTLLINLYIVAHPTASDNVKDSIITKVLSAWEKSGD